MWLEYKLCNNCCDEYIESPVGIYGTALESGLRRSTWACSCWEDTNCNIFLVDFHCIILQRIPNSDSAEGNTMNKTAQYRQTFGIYLSWTCLQIQVQQYFCQGKEIDICENIILFPRDGTKILTFYCIDHLCFWSMKTKTMFDKFHSDVYYKLLRLVSFFHLV